MSSIFGLQYSLPFSFVNSDGMITFTRETEKQTVAFNLKAREEFKKTKRARMSVWKAIELLNTLVDDSDPDVRYLFTFAHIDVIHR